MIREKIRQKLSVYLRRFAHQLDPRTETCLQGGLTLVPMPGFEDFARDIKEKIEKGSIASQQRYTAVDIVYPKIGEHANGEPYVELSKEHVGGHDCILLTSGPGTRTMMMDTLLVLYYLVGRDARRITVINGYYPLSRSDKDEGDLILALAPFFAREVISICGDKLSKIIAVDLHASQIVLSLSPGKITEVNLGRRLLKQAMQEAQRSKRPFVIAFPDDSARKRYEKILEKVEQELRIHVPTVTAAKRRSDSKSSAVQYLIGDLDKLKGAIVITCDDEIATAGTNINAATVFVKEYKATEVWAIVPHGVLCGPAAEKLGKKDCPIKRVFITDTIPVKTRKALQGLTDSNILHVVEWWQDLAWVIYQHHWGKSIRNLR
ncbi:hypothetical protein A2239_04400 [Candidatus Uhrbacteria bacterium RIFOXYA2_FULL_40_9]|nr:MAG: Ribose-phosphate pyrophosphokinase [Candidatus Uhrbacteria bacterium GW2011_GWF2_40_263]OGL93634.1 MAG: hypothetical protein A2239_04400 [Candidatus Uhrbacteria bacterium RIFOXYA2_FULL_40_9]OGL97323.1 MAG: hypothetical protein A2332_03620 [Candidatus Uhrbacteria bacterium RIFOXYB2_FULL_41_18]